MAIGFKPMRFETNDNRRGVCITHGVHRTNVFANLESKPFEAIRFFCCL